MTTPDPQVTPPVGGETPPPETVKEKEPETPADNPAWAPIFKEFDDDPSMKFIADRIKDKLRPHLASQDKAFQDVTTKYAPYKELVDAGYPADYITTSVNTFRALNESPKEFHRRLSEHLGISIAEAKEVAKAAEEDADNKDGDDSEPVDPRLKALEDRTNELMTAEETRQYNAQVEQFQRKIDADIKKAKATHEANPAFAGVPFDDNEVLEFAKMQTFDGKEISIEAAYQSWANSVLKWRSFPTPGSRAPVVTPTSGGGTGLPLNTDSGKMPDEVIRAGKESRLEWARKNLLNKS